MANLTKSNVFSESFNIVKTFLDGISNLDPRKRFKVNWIHASMPRVNDKQFNGYPFIVIQSNLSESDKTFDVETSQKEFSVLLTVYSDQATEIDTICDLIHANFKDETKLTEFKAREIASSEFNWNMDENGRKIHNRALGFIMRSRI